MIKFNFLKIIRSLLRGPNMSYIFTNVNVKQIEDKINLKENATNDDCFDLGSEKS